MGYQELIDSLRKDSAANIQALQAEAEAEAEKIRTETAGRIRQLREDFRLNEISMFREQEADALSKAREKVRALRLSAVDDCFL